jgi:hypothetical protein
MTKLRKVCRRLMPSPAMAVGSVALVVAVGGVAVASIPGRSGVITSCFDTSSGGLRIIDAAKRGHAAKCHPGERRLTWNKQGPRGVEGKRGQSAPSADVRVTGNAVVDASAPGVVIYHFTVVNAGPSAAWVALDDTLSPEGGFGGAASPVTVDQGNCTAGMGARAMVHCELGILPPRGTDRIGVREFYCGNQVFKPTNVAVINSPTLDPAPANNRAAITTSVQGTGCG